MKAANDTLLDGDTANWGSDWTSEAILLQYLTSFSIQLEFIGFPVGTLSVEISNADNANKEGTVWTKYAGSEQIISEAGDHTWAVENVCYRWVRVKWEPSAGAATLTSARFNAKQ